MAFSIGIDLGTTNTVLSTARRGVNGTIEVLTESLPQIGEDGMKLEYDTLLPSVLYVDGDEHNVGKVAKAMKSQSKNNVVSNSKNFIGQRDYKWTIEGKEYSPEMVESYFLSAVRKFLVDKYGDGDQIISAVITVPASFDIDQRNSTKTAAKLAGFNGDITLISEPTAAVLDFINEQSKLDDKDKYLDLSDFKNILVFDLGGGTCDVAILRIKVVGRNINVEEVAVSPHTLIGGTKCDAYAVEGIISDFEKENNIVLRNELEEEQLNLLKSKLLANLENVKIYFSTKYHMKRDAEVDKEKLLTSIKIPVQIPNIINGKPFKYELNMRRYNEYIKSLLTKGGNNENIISPIDKAISESGVSKEDIDYIFCVGGMTRYPEVWNIITDYFGREPFKFFDSMESVSKGASVYHYYEVENLNRNNPNNKENSQRESENEDSIIVTPTLPNTVFLNVENGFPITLIEGKTKAGTPIILENVIEVTSEIGVILELYMGRSIFDPDMKKLENLKLNFPHAVKAGTGITLKLEYTDKGILNFEAWISDNPEIKLQVLLEKSQLADEEIDDIKKNFRITEVGGIVL